MFNLVLAGAAGDGIESASSIIEKLLKESGYYVFTVKDYMSRIRGGHNFVKIRISNKPIFAHRDGIDFLFAINKDVYTFHENNLNDDAYTLIGDSLELDIENSLRVPLIDMANQLGNKKVFTSIALGLIMKHIGVSLVNVDKIIENVLPKKYLDVNLQAFYKGYDLGETKNKILPKYDTQIDEMVINGSKAVALGALSSNLKFFSSYPMSPATEILEFLQKHRSDVVVEVIQAEDEIAAIHLALGASYAGVRSMVATSGGGFSLMVEALGFSGMAEIPLVIVNAQRPGPSTGLPTRTEQSDLLFMTSASHGEFPRMVIALRNHSDAFYQTARALLLAEKYRIPVILLSDQFLADSSSVVSTFDIEKISDIENFYNDKTTKNYEFTDGVVSPRLIPSYSDGIVRVDSDEHNEEGTITEAADVRKMMMDKRMKKLKELENELMEPNYTGSENPNILIVCFGSMSEIVKEAVDVYNQKNEISLGALLFGDVYPLPQKELRKYFKKVNKIISVEQNATAQLASLIQQETGIMCHYSLLKYDGRQLNVDELIRKIDEQEAISNGKNN